MTRSKFQWFFCLCFSHSLLGFYVFVLEVCRCQVFSVKWPPYSPSLQTTLSWNQQSIVLPQIHSPQTRLTVQKGDTVQLPCKIHDLRDGQVLWRGAGSNVLAGSNVTKVLDDRITLLDDFTLQISKVAHSDEGEYECIVTSLPHYSVSLIHSVVVQDAPTVSLLTPTSIVVTEGESVEIGCIPHGNPLPKISWSMRGGQIPIHKNLLNQSRIMLDRVSRKHKGLWVCTAHNGIGRPAIGAVYVRVLYAPEIEIPWRRLHGGVGYKAKLTCIVDADPKPDIKWRIGADYISNSDRVYTETNGINEYRLIINSVKPSDFVTYSIEANNTLGYDVKNIEFSGVPNPPILTRWETDLWRKTTDNLTTDEIEVTLYWAVECYSSLIDYRLFFRPAPIPTQVNNFNEDKVTQWTELTIPSDQSSGSFLHTKSFTLRGLKNSTIYEAAVKARNKYGWSLLSAVCYFGTFPNSSSSKNQHMEEIMTKLNTPAAEADGRRGFSSFESDNPPSAGTGSIFVQFKFCCLLSIVSAVMIF